MYADPSLIRKHATKVYLNDAEQQVIDAIVRYTGEEKAALIRSLVMEAAVKVIHGQESDAPRPPMRGAQTARYST